MRLVSCKVLAMSVLIWGLSLSAAQAYDSQWAHRQLATRSLELWQQRQGAVVTEEQRRWLANGAEEEDYPALRCLNHFYQPSTERPLVIRGLWLGHTALQWSTSSQWQSSGWGGDYAWSTGVEALKNGDDHLAWLVLGHNLHLLADLASPAHVHNDDHAEGDPYEDYVKKALREGKLSVSQLLASTEPVNCMSVEGCLQAMAEYTERYALSKDWSLVSDMPHGAKLAGDGKFYLDGKVLGKGDDVSERVTLDDEVYEAYWHDLAPRVIAYGQRMIELYWQAAGRQPELLTNDEAVSKADDHKTPEPIRVRIPAITIIEIAKPKLPKVPVADSSAPKSSSELKPEWPIVDESLVIPIEYLRDDWWPMIINGGALPASAAPVTEIAQVESTPSSVTSPPADNNQSNNSESDPVTNPVPNPDDQTGGANSGSTGGGSPTVTSTEPLDPEPKVEQTWPSVRFFSLPKEYSGLVDIFWEASPAGLWRYDLSVAYDQGVSKKIVDGEMLNFYSFKAEQEHELLKLSLLAIRNDGVRVGTTTEIYFKAN